MTEYLKPGGFSVSLGTKNYRDNWDAVFGKKEKAEEPKALLKNPEEARRDLEFARHALLQEISGEREVQDEKWGGPDHDDTHSEEDWESYIRSRLNRPLSDTAVPLKKPFRERMVEIAALALAALESQDRKLFDARK